ncbi:hypothetical protein ACQ4PT_043931 [Festuca glaucescens]
MENVTGMAASPVAYAYPGGICRMLVVEEDPSCLAALTEMLQRRGYPVTAMASPEEGLRALRDNPEAFDLVMTVAHTRGPGIDGFELLKHARESHPVILFSDYAPETRRRAMLEGACDFLPKPLCDAYVRYIWQNVLLLKLLVASGVVVIGRDDTARKRGSGVLDESDESGSDGSQQQEQGRTTKKTKFNSSPQQHVLLVKAAEQLRGTKGNCIRRLYLLNFLVLAYRVW